MVKIKGGINAKNSKGEFLKEIYPWLAYMNENKELHGKVISSVVNNWLMRTGELVVVIEGAGHSNCFMPEQLEVMD